MLTLVVAIDAAFATASAFATDSAFETADAPDTPFASDRALATEDPATALASEMAVAWPVAYNQSQSQ